MKDPPPLAAKDPDGSSEFFTNSGLLNSIFDAMIHRRAPLLLCAVFLLAALVVQGDAPDQFNFAEALFIQLDYDSAAEEFQTYLDKYSEGDQVAKARYRIAECHFRTENFEKAVRAYRTALAKHPDAEQAPLAHYNRARALQRLDRTQDAADSFASAAEAGKGKIRREALLGAAEARVALEQYESALKRYNQLLDEFPDSQHVPDTLFSLGWVHARLGRHEQAVPPLERLIAKYPDYGDLPRAQLALSDSLTALGKYAQSAAVLGNIKTNQALTDEVMLRRAWNQFRAGDKLEAANSFEAYAGKFPDNERAASALFNAGAARLESGRYDDAAKTFQRILDGAPSEKQATDARYWLAVCRFNAGKYEQAISILAPLSGKAINLPEERRETVDSMLAQSLQHAGQHKEAVKRLRSFLSTHPQSAHRPTILYSLAAALEASGELNDAVDALERLLEQHPDSELAPDARFALAEYLYRLDRPADAMPHLQALAEADELTTPARYRLAWCHYDLQNFEDARTHFADLAGRNSEFKAEAHYMAGRASEQIGAADKAEDWYRKTAALKEDAPPVEKAYLRLSFLTDREQAAADYRAYTERFPNGRYIDSIRLRLAESAFADGDEDAAATHYQALIEKDAKNAAAAYGLAWCRLKQNDPEAADSLFKRALKNADEDASFRADALLQRAELAYKAEEYSRAQKLFSQVKDNEAIGERAIYMLGWCARKRENPEQSRTWFRTVVERYPEGEFRMDAALRLAEADRRADQPKEARQVMEQALENIPDEQITEEFLHLYSDTLVDLRDWKGVLETCDRLESAHPNSERGYQVSFRRGLAYQALGIPDKAEAAFRKTIDATDTIEAARAQFNIGSVAFSRGDFVDAAKSFLRVDMLYDYPELAPKALYHAVLSFRKAEDERRANIYASKLKQSYPDSTWSAKLTDEDNE